MVLYELSWDLHGGTDIPFLQLAARGKVRDLRCLSRRR